MKRYFCEKCLRVVRCHRLPDNVTENHNGAAQPGHQLIGICRHHTESGTRHQINHRGRVLAHLGSTRKISASSAKAKSKK